MSIKVLSRVRKTNNKCDMFAYKHYVNAERTDVAAARVTLVSCDK